MKRFVIILPFLLLSSLSFAQRSDDTRSEIIIDKHTGVVTAINNLGLDASRTSSAINVSGWSLAKVQVRYTYAAATVVTMTFEESDDGTTWSKITQIATTGAMSQFTPYWTTSAASANFTFQLDVTGYSYIRVTITSTGGSSSDKAYVYVRNARGI